MNRRCIDTIRKSRHVRTVATLCILLSVFALELIRFLGDPNAFFFQNHPRAQQAHILYQSQQAKSERSSPPLGARNSALPTQKAVWTQKETVLLETPESTQPLAHLGKNFPLTFLGNTRWVSGHRWDHVSWSSPTHTWNGWVADTMITPTSSGHIASASFDALSPELANYLARFGSDIGITLYDVSHQRSYTDNANTFFLTASSMKVPIMFAYLDQLEQQGIEPDMQAIDELTAMIENSDNDSASNLYSDINASAGINTFLQKIGVSGLQADDDAWGYSLTTPQTMVDLFTKLHNGTILNAQDRSLAFTLLENIESDQRQGLGDTAPQGSTVAMKNGWVPNADGSWVVNTSGIVTAGQETYILSVYVQNQPSQEIGQNILQHICSQISSSLI